MKPDQPQLLIDSDALCKLAAANLLDDALALLGVAKEQCARLPALVPMLRRGVFRKHLGDAEADRLRPIAAAFPIMCEPDAEWLDPLTGIPGIDIGEAQIYALAAQHGLRVLTGDKRAIAEVSKLAQFSARLDGRMVTVEAVLLALADTMDAATFRARVKELVPFDSTVRAAYGSAGAALKEGLASYMEAAERSTNPMKLWRPGSGGFGE